MKITLLRLKSSKFGGAEVYLSRLSEELKKRGIKFDIKYTSAPKFLSSWLKIIWYNLEVCLLKGNKFYFSLERVICPDIYRAGDGVHKTFLKIENKSKLNPLHFVYLYIEKRMFKNAKKIIAISNMVKRNIIEEYNVPSEKIEVIYNGIPLKEKVPFDELKKEFNINNEKILLYVGSGFKRKGVKEALDIVSKLKGNFKFFVVGKEKNIEWYKSYAKELNIENKVVFTGPRSDVDKFYSMADIFIFPTKYEPFGSVIIEALNFENVVFTTDMCGGGEILPEEWIIDDNIVNKIQELLNNNKKLDELKKKAKDISKNYSIEKNVDETIKVINEVIN
ncbi:glycosyl transferase [Nautilia sp. PV-1]|uniref:glycosyltransferase family 4 protein n=1 Tax=Nautilia sp. PV-1 TaxID=2579250 RepID=UPI000FDA6D9B|nr:glycosyltransferase family 4 protein [Nautilia sp. PV-1]AZV47376.1 glycosyl transferase [Nautilia sp. PV-1]